MELQFNTNKLEVLNAEIGFWRIPQFFSPELLTFFEKNILNQEFTPRQSVDDGVQMVFKELGLENKHTKLMYLLMQDQVLIQNLAQRTGLNDLKSCASRIYKFIPHGSNTFDWHNDLCHGRTLGFSVNLTREKFEGAKFMIRKKQDHSVSAEFHNTGYGDAILFKISAELEHCVSPLTGSTPRLAYAGWFTV